MIHSDSQEVHSLVVPRGHQQSQRSTSSKGLLPLQSPYEMLRCRDLERSMTLGQFKTVTGCRADLFPSGNYQIETHFCTTTCISMEAGLNKGNTVKPEV